MATLQTQCMKTIMRKKNLTYILCLVFILFATHSLHAEDKPDFRVRLFVNPLGEDVYQKLVVQEITALLDTRYRLNIQIEGFDGSDIEKSTKAIRKALHDNSIDCLIGLGLNASNVLSRFHNYPKPVIAGAILDQQLQGIPMTPKGTSGISNFNYIQSPFNVEKDLATFKKLIDFKHLAILYNARETYMFHNIYSYLGRAAEKIAPEAKLTIIEVYSDNIEDSVADMPQDVDAVYLPPVFLGREDDQQKKLIEEINNRKLPSFALLGEESVQMGAMASIAPDRNLNAMARRIAINLLNIGDGQNPGDLPVQVANYSDNFVINVGTLREIDYYPRWQVLNSAKLINLAGIEGKGRQLNLKTVIMEALERNLELQIEQENTSLQTEEVGLAKAPLLPHLTLSSSVNLLDDNRADNEPGSPARSTWSATGELSQTVYSDDVLANLSIQKTLLESQKYTEKATLLDTVVTAAEAYINLLFARSNQEIQNTNLSVTRKNLDISRNKEAVGSVGSSEVHRWESEQSSNQISLNDSFRDVQLARMRLNQLLDRSINQEIKAIDLDVQTTPIELLITDPEVYKYLENLKKISIFSDFLITEADRNLPELKEVEATLRAIEREIVNRKRAFYLPGVRMQGTINKILDEYDTRYETPSELDHPWTVAATASWPLFSGNSKRYDLVKSRIRLRQTRLQARNLRNQLHLAVRSNLETAAVSAREIELAQIGLDAAVKNFDIIQAGYSEGRNTIADLIDAQNSKINSERAEAVAKYQFVLDFLLLERSIGRFHFLDSQKDKLLFLHRLRQFMETN